MYAFVADQILGINGLVNVSNIVFLAAFSVRDVLKLRLLSIAGEALILPYYYFQTETLWSPVFWGAAFMLVNAVRIVAMALERRPELRASLQQIVSMDLSAKLRDVTTAVSGVAAGAIPSGSPPNGA